MFEEYTYHPEPPRRDSQHSQSQQPPTSQEDNKTSFEIPLNTVIECLNIFGSSGSSANSKSKKWRMNNSNNEGGADNDDDNRTGPLDNFFSSSEKGTAIRISYNGSGHPLELLMSVSFKPTLSDS
jgi:cell cycle checkpoint protein